MARNFRPPNAKLKLTMGTRKVGPSGLTGGLLADVEQAQADKLGVADLTQLLAAYRSGDPDAGQRLLRGLRHVPYTFFLSARPTARIAAEDVLGTLFVDFGDCVRRLRANAIPAEDVERYIRADLKHAVTHYAAECSPHVRAKASTNSERAKRGVDPHPDLQKEPAMIGQQDRLQIPESDDAGIPLADQLREVAKTPIEDEIVEYLQAGKDRAEIADLLGTTVYRVRDIVARLKTRIQA